MSDLVTKYPLDLTGVNPTNKIEGEIRELSPGINRSVVPRYGAFYYDQLQIRDLDSNQILVPNDQFVPIMFHQPATERSGKEVFGGVVIVDTTVSNNLAIDYQAVGGEYQDIVPLILDIIDNLNLDNRTVAWGDLLGRPDAFAPAPHLHDVGDVYGFEYLVESINAVREAILLSDQGVFDELRAQIEARHATAMQGIADLTSDFNDHESNFANPHSVNKVQVGLGNVENYPIATQGEGEAGTATNRYMTPLRTKQAITIQIGNAFNAHRADRDNPHAVTKAQVGLGSVENYPIASLSEAEAGTASNRYMTPLRTAQAIQEQAGNALAAHTSDVSNPHNVTKAQVGLGNVENHTLASQAEAQAGTSNSRYMTPLRTQQAIMTLAGNALNGHMSNTSNPHSVTKAQVGLGSVENLGLASQAEAQAGTSNAKYMTPLRTAQAITQQAGTALSGHTSNTNNPHSVTKAQVGLGNVTNDRQVKRAGDTMTGDLNFEAAGRGVTWNMNTDGAAIMFISSSDSDPDARLEFQTRDNETEYFRWVAAANTGVVKSEWMTLKKLGLIVNGRVTATAFYGNGANLTGMSKSQVGLANVENYVVATQSEAQAGSRNDRYMTPLRTSQAITQQAGAALSGHTSNTNNPHSVTKAQVGLGNVDNIASTTTVAADRIVRRDSSGDVHARLFRSEYNSTNGNIGFIMTQVDTGTNNFLRPSTPAQVKAALGVTKSDVGLSQVQNLGLASQAEAEAGTVNNKYMTPLRTKQAITQQAAAAVASHINDTNNPHSVTKVQVGLGNVENYPIASLSEAEAGTVNNKYMTPQRTAQAIDKKLSELSLDELRDALIPTGAVQAFAGPQQPLGWLVCNGAYYLISDYPKLYAVIGSIYGISGNYFRVPDLRGRFVRGWNDNTHGTTPDINRAFGSTQVDAMQLIKGNFVAGNRNQGTSAYTGPFRIISSGSSNWEHRGPSNSAERKVEFDSSKVTRTADETRPHNVAMRYCIKY